MLIYFLGCISALGYLWFTARPVGTLRSAVKTAPILLFAAASLVAGGPGWLILALLLSAAGDLALSREGRTAFLAGLSAFALAHLAFILLFQSLGGSQLWDALARAPVWSALLVGAALSTEIWLAPHTGAMRWPVRIYVALITVMGLAALALPAGFGGVAVGAGLFILSDMVLSVRLFRLTGASPWALPAALALWVLYIAGQALIVAGTAPL